MTTLETLRSDLRQNREAIDDIEAGPITVGSLLARELHQARRHALLNRIEREMGR